MNHRTLHSPGRLAAVIPGTLRGSHATTAGPSADARSCPNARGWRATSRWSARQTPPGSPDRYATPRAGSRQAVRDPGQLVAGQVPAGVMPANSKRAFADGEPVPATGADGH